MSKALILTLGSDPELVIVGPDSTRPLSAKRILKNDKHHPHELGNGVKFYADNVLAELAFPPATEAEALVDTLVNAMQEALDFLDGYRLLAQAATFFPQRELRNRQAWMIGCDPNYNGYGFHPDMPKDQQFDQNFPEPFFDTMRTGSFHIHVGNADYESGQDQRLLTNESKMLAVMLMDMFVGLPSIIFDHDPTSPMRRKLYGKAGEFRPTPYGIEYRVLGNYALRHTRLMHLVMQLTQAAMQHVADGTERDALALASPRDIIRIINEHDVGKAKSFIRTLPIPPALVAAVLAESPIDNTLAWTEESP